MYFGVPFSGLLIIEIVPLLDELGRPVVPSGTSFQKQMSSLIFHTEGIKR
jgi:hypothetical protein